MGASEFYGIHVGPDPRSTFSRAVDEAAWENGHGGYSGSLAEKHDYVVLTLPDLPAGVTPYDLVETCLNYGDFTSFQLYRKPRGEDGKVVEVSIPPTLASQMKRISEAVDDKWGPAGLIDVTDTPSGQGAVGESGQRAYLIFGWASS